jgi:hypothetical protein
MGTVQSGRGLGRDVGESRMTPETQIDPPDPPKSNTKAFWVAYALKMQAERDVLIAARDAAAVVPPKRYRRIGIAEFETSIAYKTLYDWHIKKKIESYVPEGTSEIMIEVNSAIGRATSTGLYLKHAKRKKPP